MICSPYRYPSGFQQIIPLYPDTSALFYSFCILYLYLHFLIFTCLIFLCAVQEKLDASAIIVEMIKKKMNRKLQELSLFSLVYSRSQFYQKRI